MKRQIFLVSDRTGITVEMLGHTLLTQFEEMDFEYIHRPYVDSADKVRAVVDEINLIAGQHSDRPLVFSSLVDPVWREQLGRSRGLLLDLFDAFIFPLETEFGLRASHSVGRSHGIGVYATYKTRIDAVNFVLANDDGADLRHYPDADIILIGVSRSGKTPTCLYLALHYGILAANYPLTEDDFGSTGLPAALSPFRGKLYGLTIDPDRLRQIRTERRPDSPYSSAEKCRFEVQHAEQLYRKEQIPFLDTSAVSIEEIATTILQNAGLKRHI